MIRPDFAHWDQSAADIHRLSIEADHPRSRERFQALYMIGTGQSNANQWANQTGRCKQTILKWVHLYRDHGPSRLYYQQTGGRQAKLEEAEKKGSSRQSSTISPSSITCRAMAGPSRNCNAG